MRRGRIGLGTLGKSAADRPTQLRREHPLTVRSVAHAAYERGGEEIKASICFAETKTQFGGRRLWFICPSCGGRCRVLFHLALAYVSALLRSALQLPKGDASGSRDAKMRNTPNVA